MNVPTSAKRYSGRTFGPEDIERVRTLIHEHPRTTRQRLSYLICEALDWRKPDGGLKDMSCRVAMLRLHREGLIELPAPRHKVNPCRSFTRRTAQAEPQAIFEAPVGELGAVRLERVTRLGSALWNDYIDRYHYLGYKPLPGAQLRYFAWAGERLVGLLGFGAVAWKTGPRDAWIGWSRAQRQRNLGVWSTTQGFSATAPALPYLLHPCSRDTALDSRPVSGEQAVVDGGSGAGAGLGGRYGYRPVLLESFVEAQRFRGTCYRAANWRCVGQT
jgi:hypothetical protein